MLAIISFIGIFLIILYWSYVLVPEIIIYMKDA